MKKAEKFVDLEVWKEAHEMVLNIYKATRDFPYEERYELVSQMRRAAISVPANIAEGFKRRTDKDKVNFYNIAQSSLEELRYYLILAKDLGYLKQGKDLEILIDDIGKMLFRFVSSFKSLNIK